MGSPWQGSCLKFCGTVWGEVAVSCHHSRRVKEYWEQKSCSQRRGHQPSLSWKCLKDLNDPKPFHWNGEYQGTYKDGARGKALPVIARSELGTAGWESIQIIPLTVSCNVKLCLIYTRSDSYPCDFPSVALLWIVYFANTGYVASKSFLLLQRFARRGGSLLAMSADAFYSSRTPPWSSITQNQSGPVVLFIKKSERRCVFCLVQ